VDIISLCAGVVYDIYIIIITVMLCKQSCFCISQGSAATLFRRGGRVYNFLMWNFLGIFYTKVTEIDSVFKADVFEACCTVCFHSRIYAESAVKSSPTNSHSLDYISVHIAIHQHCCFWATLDI